MVLPHWLGLVDRVWRAARDPIHQHEVNKYNIKNTDFIYVSYHIQSIDISLENYRFVRVRTRSNWFSKLLATPDL